MIRSLYKNGLLPKQSAGGCNGVRKGGLGFGIPLCAAQPDSMMPHVLSKNQAHDAKQPRQAGSGTQYRFGHILSRWISRRLVVHETFELSRADGVLELADRLGFDLPDTLAGDFEDASDLL